MSEINDNTTYWDEQIDRFVCNEMSAEEERDFIRHVQADENLRSHVVASTQLISAIRRHGLTQDKELVRTVRAASSKDIYAAIGKKRPKALIVRLIPIIAVAACVCAFFGNSYLMRSSAIDFAEHAGIEPLDAARGGEGMTDISRLVDNVKADKNLPQTINELQKIINAMPDGDSAEYRTAGWYLAMAYIKEGRTDDAVKLLREIITRCPDFQEAWQLRDMLSRTFFWQ